MCRFDVISAYGQEIAGESALGEFATTLLVAVAAGPWLSAAQVGDGAMVCRNTAGTLELLSKVRNGGEYVNETTFLTSADYLAGLHRRSLPAAEVDGLALFTDGIELLAITYPANSPHAPFFKPLFAFAEGDEATQAELEIFLRSDRVCERTDDDKTLIVAVRSGTHEAG